MLYDQMLSDLTNAGSVGAEILKRTAQRRADVENTYDLRFGHLGPADLDKTRDHNLKIAREATAQQVQRLLNGTDTMSPEYVRTTAWSGECWAIAECIRQSL